MRDDTMRIIHASAPYRVSLFGGGTDYKSWFTSHDGLTISAAIKQRCHVFVRHNPFQDIGYRIVWRHVELTNSVSDILHPAVRGALKMLDIESPIEIHHIGELPARSGVGSSSAFACALLAGLHEFKGERPIPTEQIMKEAIELERVILKEAGGLQDQVTCSFGGFLITRYPRNQVIKVADMDMPLSRMWDLQSRLFLVDTGITRTSSDIVQSMHGESEDEHRANVQEIAEEALVILEQEDEDLDQIGHLLDASWQHKKRFAEGISTPMLDRIYDIGLEFGAIGGKAIGAGGGGFMLFYVPEDDIPGFLNHMPYNIIEVEFSYHGVKAEYLNE